MFRGIRVVLGGSRRWKGLHVDKQTGSLALLAVVALFSGQTRSRKHWLVDRLHRTARKAGQHECEGLCVRAHVSSVQFRGAPDTPTPPCFFNVNLRGVTGVNKQIMIKC